MVIQTFNNSPSTSLSRFGKKSIIISSQSIFSLVSLVTNPLSYFLPQRHKKQLFANLPHMKRVLICQRQPDKWLFGSPQKKKMHHPSFIHRQEWTGPNFDLPYSPPYFPNSVPCILESEPDSKILFGLSSLQPSSIGLYSKVFPIVYYLNEIYNVIQIHILNML